MEARALITQGDWLFGQRLTFLSMLQEIAEHFYPERADFTVNRSLGNSFADNLTTSYPLLVRRDLGNSLGTMQRPIGAEWFHMKTEREEDEDQPAKAWMESRTAIMRRAMYDRRSQFTKASKQGDHDIAAFGQCVKSVELNRDADGLLYRCWHIRDCAWAEDSEGVITTFHRKAKMTCADICKIFGPKAHPKIHDKTSGPNPTPYMQVEVRHIVLLAEDYREDFIGKARAKFVSIYVDVENNHVMEAVGKPHMNYVIPRWQTVSGSQYAYSPATIAALPDARLIQAITRTLLEAGEKATNPPMVAVQEAMRSDIAIYAGGITWVDAEYDERLGEVLRPLTQDKSGLPVGMDMREDIRDSLSDAFFINKLTMPQNGPEMTAYEVGQRVQDYIRQASPLFEPLEQEDNGAVCELTFDLLMRNGAFGSTDDIPDSLRGKEIGWRFESPLHEAIERQKGQKFNEAMQVTAQTIQIYPDAPAQIDFKTAFRDVLLSIGTPAKWIRSEQDVEAIEEQARQQEQTQELLAGLQQGAETAQALGDAGQSLGMAA